MRLSDFHQTVIARIHADSRWSHLRVGGSDFVNKTLVGGYNARTLSVLRRAGLVESQAFAGPRGRHIVGIKLTDAGKAVARRVSDLAEGLAPLGTDGNQSRDVAGFTLED